MKTPIQTRDAPEAIGTYSQAVRAGDTCVSVRARSASTRPPCRWPTASTGRRIACSATWRRSPTAAGLSLDHAVRMTVYLTDLAHFARVNEIMAQYVREPYPARAAVGVAGLPRGALVEIDAILHAN